MATINCNNRKLLLLLLLQWITLLNYYPSCHGQEVFDIERLQSDNIQHVVIHQVNGDVYVGATNTIVKLTANLTWQSNSTTGPQMDNPLCLPDTNCNHPRKLTDNINKLLLINYQGNSLITCGSVFLGRCQLRDLKTLANRQEPTISVASNDPNATTYGFIGAGPDHENVLYVGATHTQHGGGDWYKVVLAVSTRRLKHISVTEVALSVYDNTNSQFNYDDPNYYIDYHYGFISGSYSYFLTVQKGVVINGFNSVIDQRYESRVVRLCSADATYTSYVETPLKCLGRNNINYNLLQAAYTIKPGSSLATSLGITTREDIIIGVFAASTTPSSKIPSTSSAVCIFTIAQVNKVLRDTIRNCLAGGISRGLPWDTKGAGSKKCTKVDLNTVPECSRRYLSNPRIGGNISVTTTAVREYSNRLLTSIVAFSADSTTLAFIGTSDGDIVKLSINSKSIATQYFEEHVAQLPINSLAFAKDSGKYYAATSKTVHRLPLEKCQQYLDCNQCILSADPLCGWCVFDNRCSRKSSCVKNTYWLGRGDTSRCINITSISPSSVSIESQATVSIKMLNLNSLPILSYTCSYGSNYGEYTASLLPGSSDTLQCLTPRYVALSNAVPVHGYKNIPLSVSVNLANSVKRITIANRVIQFYNCTSYQSSCATCTTSPFNCVWCLYDYTCNSNANTCSTVSIGRNSAWRSSICPVIQASKISLPLNIRREIIISVMFYDCQFRSSDCGLCLSFRYEGGSECGWCQGATSMCSTRDQCSSNNRWIGYRCPNPTITSISPSYGPLEGGTPITIKGINLGSRFSDVTHITVGRIKCQTIPNNYKISHQIVCITGNSSNNLSSRIHLDVFGITISSQENFHYLNPIVKQIFPIRGPKSGGSVLTIMGNNLNVGNNVVVTAAGIPCKLLWRNESKIECITSRLSQIIATPSKGNRMAPLAAGSVVISYDGKAHRKSSESFVYTNDPTFTDLNPPRTIQSGGLTIKITGSNFNSIVKPVMFVILWLKSGNRTVYSDSVCDNSIPTGATMYCKSPNISPYVNRSTLSSQEIKANIGFIMDGVKSMERLYVAQRKESAIALSPDPVIFKFGRNPHKHEGKILAINGSNLIEAATRSDYRVHIGNHECQVYTVKEKAILCELPVNKISTRAGEDYPNVHVSIGNLKFHVGRLRYEVKEFPVIPLTIGSIAGGAVLIIVTILVIIYHRRKVKSNKEHVLNIRQKYDEMGQTLAGECRRAFTELQTGMCDLANDLDVSGAPQHPFRVYIHKMLFPNVKHGEMHPVFAPISVRGSRKSRLEDSLSSFLDLLLRDKFLITFIATLEKQPDFKPKDKCNIASFLIVALHENMDYVTKVLMKLLIEMIRKLPPKGQPQLFLKRNDSITEKLLSNWLALCLYQYSNKRFGQPLYLLYHAIKQQISKGPVDQKTGEARYCLSEEKLLREQVDETEISVMASIGDGQQISLKLFDCDTITQAKEKILDAIYINQPYSARPSVAEFELEAVTVRHGQPPYRLPMFDEDSSNEVYENGWYKLNTIGHYKITDNTTLKLHRVYNRNSDTFSISTTYQYTRPSRNQLHARYNNVSNQVTLGGNKENLSQPLPNQVREKAFHLMKHSDSNTTNERILPEAFLMCLLLTKGTLQQYTQDLFESLFTLPHHSNTFPLAIKYLFDFLNSQASQMQFNDPAVVKSWKNNTLPLRYYINIIRNPQFLFDIDKSPIVDSCLSVISQAFGDACSVSDTKVSKDSPSNRLLYAREIPRYRDKVAEFYKSIQNLPTVSEKEMMKEMKLLSETLKDDLDKSSALLQLYDYAYSNIKAFEDNLRNANLVHLFDVFVNRVVNGLQEDSTC
ncbi:uncharacterized protein TRIADDRAFT_56941 [Trichoplax adhaerens]|uniref:Sema domain-containing protein n=1 Tax=Trichoplax adhaerens TaxID=10228 RepID=B3RWZ7_TRIAD|nr:hypothetical protein TRIADDRAFT_56941 [Trichoplax adhaerens]EDV24780.1 hypothetical protein TRIADDRAFT_56941 [Trichoplax adhaerens]|eukprot:XP_002112670.1 hypothetical protein TRIADDRAFT_56941 [Trichoplax adhaerens]